MILIYGGKYQGKLDFTKEKFDIDDKYVLDLYDFLYIKNQDYDKLDFDKDNICIYNINFLYKKLIEEGADPIIYTRDKILKCLPHKNVYIIAIDESCGVVPLDEKRIEREKISKSINILSKEAKEVYRVFVGIGVKIK